MQQEPWCVREQRRPRCSLRCTVVQVAQDVDNPNNWTDIAEEMRGAFRGRNGKSCRLRWCNQLDPKLRKDAFSDWEDAVIIKAHAVRTPSCHGYLSGETSAESAPSFVHSSRTLHVFPCMLQVCPCMHLLHSLKLYCARQASRAASLHCDDQTM